MVMPLASWIDEKQAWKTPFERLNATPHSIDELCDTHPLDRLGPAALSLQ
jgi:hypothetical protein